jgi:hypothetical protein
LSSLGEFYMAPDGVGCLELEKYLYCHCDTLLPFC